MQILLRTQRYVVAALLSVILGAILFVCCSARYCIEIKSRRKICRRSLIYYRAFPLFRLAAGALSQKNKGINILSGHARAHPLAAKSCFASGVGQLLSRLCCAKFASAFKSLRVNIYMYFCHSIDALLPSALGETDLHTNSTCTRQGNIRKVARPPACKHRISRSSARSSETSSRWKSTWLKDGAGGLFCSRGCDGTTKAWILLSPRTYLNNLRKTPVST
jgi:hypothetical protein